MAGTEGSQKNQNRNVGGDYSNEVKDMIEVKTSSSYKIGRQTINARIGEDFEPDKPIVTYQNNQENMLTPAVQANRRTTNNSS